MSDNLRIYDAVRAVPPNAKKPIQAGRLKGKTDINPMWRLKTLTEQFGPCGFGWRYVITDKRLEPGANGEIAAFVDIDLYVKMDGEWSVAIPGTGGSAFVAKEKSGLYVSDECFKMALTDAISVACKALGFAADIYWEKDDTKYSKGPEQRDTAPGASRADRPITEPQIKRMFALAGKGREGIVRQVLDEYGYEGTRDVKAAKYQEICDKIVILAKEADEAIGDPATQGDAQTLLGGWDK